MKNEAILFVIFILALFGVNGYGHDVNTVLNAYEKPIEAFGEVSHDLIFKSYLHNKYKIPVKYLNILMVECDNWEIGIEHMVRMMYVESRYNPKAKSFRNAHGLFQLKYATANEIMPELESFWQLYNPEINIKIAVEYFANLLSRYDRDYKLASIAYNRGPTRLDREISGGVLIDAYHRMIKSVSVD